MEVCEVCGTVVSNLGKHKSRGRCEAVFSRRGIRGANQMDRNRALYNKGQETKERKKGWKERFKEKYFG